ncbi:uncharacterized protein BDV17DRAFT_267605 [Aspergillus undulatus]|uniref:uncharacterized protein n=1 Tax=Aspergillus undulatus TaxID=1810928 RepID=UPI003CCD3358
MMDPSTEESINQPAHHTTSIPSSNPTGNKYSGASLYPTLSTTTRIANAMRLSEASSLSRPPVMNPPPWK